MPVANVVAAPLGNPIDDAMNRADMGDLNLDSEDIKDAFEDAYTEEMERLDHLQVICTIVNLDGTYAKSEWPELYTSVATWLELGGDPQVMMQMMSGQEPEHKRTDRVKVTDYLGLYKNPVVIDFPDPTDLTKWNPLGVGDTTSKGELVRTWLDKSFDVGTVVTVSQDFGSDYVVVLPPSSPDTFVGGLLIPKLTLDCYQPVAEQQNVVTSPNQIMDTSRSANDIAKEKAKEKAKLRSLSQSLSTDRHLETRVDLLTGEIRQFNGNQLAAGEAGFTFVKTRLIKMGLNVYPVALPGVIDYCDDKGISYSILDTGSTGLPTKLEVSATLKPLLEQMGKPLKLSSGATNDMVVISYR